MGSIQKVKVLKNPKIRIHQHINLEYPFTKSKKMGIPQ